MANYIDITDEGYGTSATDLFNEGKRYFDGNHGDFDWERAAKKFSAAAVLGDEVNAKLHLAAMHAEGHGIGKDLLSGLILLREVLAQSPSLPLQYVRLGLVNEVKPSDLFLAVLLVRNYPGAFAALRNEVSDLLICLGNRLGRLQAGSELGRKLRRLEDETRRFKQQTTDLSPELWESLGQGDAAEAEACYHLGMAFSAGQLACEEAVSAPDYESALFWLHQATKAGHQGARAYLLHILGTNDLSSLDRELLASYREVYHGDLMFSKLGASLIN